MTHVQVGDAFVRGIPEDATWTIGTKAVEMAFGVKHGVFRLVGFRNKLAGRPQEYIAESSAVAPFTIGASGRNSLILTCANAAKATSGGQPVVMLTLDFATQDVKVRFHVVAYPGTSVLRQWIGIENAGASPSTVDATLLTIPVTDVPAASFTHYWMVGGNSGPDHGIMKNATVAPGYRQAVHAQATSAFMPWTALQRRGQPGDGWFVALEYMGNWTLSVESSPEGLAIVSAGITDLAAILLRPGEKIELPAVTIGAFAGSLDDMGVRSYDWQYRLSLYVGLHQRGLLRPPQVGGGLDILRPEPPRAVLCATGLPGHGCRPHA